MLASTPSAVSLPLRFLKAVGNYIRTRWVSWAFLLALLVIAIYSSQVALESKPRTLRAGTGPSLKHEPDFIATNWVQFRSSADGLTRYQLKAASLTHYRDDLSTQWVQPDISARTMANSAPAADPAISKHSTVTTRIRANTAQVFNDGERIEFAGSVRVERKADGVEPSALTSNALTMMTDTSVLSTKSAVTMTQGKSKTQSDAGLSYQHNDAELVFPGRSRTTIAAR